MQIEGMVKFDECFVEMPISHREVRGVYVVLIDITMYLAHYETSKRRECDQCSL